LVVVEGKLHQALVEELREDLVPPEHPDPHLRAELELEHNQHNHNQQEQLIMEILLDNHLLPLEVIKLVVVEVQDHLEEAQDFHLRVGVVEMVEMDNHFLDLPDH
jgi:hypothetical protein